MRREIKRIMELWNYRIANMEDSLFETLTFPVNYAKSYLSERFQNPFSKCLKMKRQGRKNLLGYITHGPPSPTGYGK